MRKFPAGIAIAELPHTAVKHRLKNGAFILNCRALEYVVARVGSGLRRGLFRLLLVLMNSLPRLHDHSVGLVAELRRQIAVPFQYHFLRLDFLLVARPMRGNLCCARALLPIPCRCSLICSRRGLDASRYPCAYPLISGWPCLPVSIPYPRFCNLTAKLGTIDARACSH